MVYKDPNSIEYNCTAGVVGKVIDIDTVAEFHGFERSDIVRAFGETLKNFDKFLQFLNNFEDSLLRIGLILFV